MALYASYFLDKKDADLIILMKGIDSALEVQIESQGTLSLLNLKLFLTSQLKGEID